jgi:uroporphyrinogen-III synthase
MDRLEAINAATNDKEMKAAVAGAQAERALKELGLKVDRINRVLAGAAKLTAKDIDAAMLARATEHANEENQRRRISKNKLQLDPTEVYSVDSAMKELFSFEKRIRLKNTLHAAGVIA